MAIAQKTGKKVIFLLLGLGVVFLAIGILNLRDRISWNDPSDGIFWTEKDQKMAVFRITGDSVPDEIRGITKCVNPKCRKVFWNGPHIADIIRKIQNMAEN